MYKNGKMQRDLIEVLKILTRFDNMSSSSYSSYLVSINAMQSSTLHDFSSFPLKPLVAVVVGGEEPSPLLSYVSYITLDSVVNHKEPR